MQITESIRLALASIRSNRMRSLLTMLGIIIGISSVITISAIGTSVKTFIEEELKGVGYEFVEILPDWAVLGDDIPEQYMLTKDEADALEERFSDVIMYCAPYAYAGASAQAGRKNAEINVSGAKKGRDKCDETIQMISGRFISDDDVNRRSNVVVIDEKASKYFFGNSNPVGKTIQLTVGDSIADYNIIGEYRTKESKLESMLEAGEKYLFYAPYSIIVGNDYTTMYLQLYLDTDDADRDANKMVSYITRIKRVEKGTIKQMSAQSEMQSINKVLDVVSLAIAAIAAISLIVGGIGIMNIMLVSVTERTREIGIRKALGARTKDIMSQFMIEAVILSCIGGAIGILLGIGTAGIVAAVVEAKLVISTMSVIISVGFSILVGLVFGLFPAKKAAGMNPIDALRYE